MGSTIAGLGHYLPERLVGNGELEARLGLDAGWIERRTGIVERRWAAGDEALSDMAVAAGERALASARVARGDIALTILATSTPDHLLPPSAPLVAHRLGLGGAGAIDMAGACAGFVYALTFADAFARTHGGGVLVIAANILSRRINFDDRGSAVLFADAAAAVVVMPVQRPDAGVLGVRLESDGAQYDLIKIPAGGSRQPFGEGVTIPETKMQLRDGRAVFVRAVRMMSDASTAALDAAGVTIGQVDHWVPHQANARIMAAAQKHLGVGDDRVMSSVALCGNSSAATIPLTLSLHAERLKSGACVLMSAAGAGMTGGALVYRL